MGKRRGEQSESRCGVGEDRSRWGELGVRMGWGKIGVEGGKRRGECDDDKSDLSDLKYLGVKV